MTPSFKSGKYSGKVQNSSRHGRITGKAMMCQADPISASTWIGFER
jgi:hypothetical protein